MTSCKKEDTKKTPGYELLGKWKGEKSIHTVTKNGTVIESETTIVTSPDFFTIEFKKGNRCQMMSSFEDELESENLFYKLDGNKIILGEDEQYLEGEIYSFEINGQNLVLKGAVTMEDAGVSWEWLTELYFSK